MTLLDCPRCGGQLEAVYVFDDANRGGELMDLYCPNPECKWEAVHDPELGDAEVTP